MRLCGPRNQSWRDAKEKHLTHRGVEPWFSNPELNHYTDCSAKHNRVLTKVWFVKTGGLWKKRVTWGCESCVDWQSFTDVAWHKTLVFSNISYVALRFVLLRLEMNASVPFYYLIAAFVKWPPMYLCVCVVGCRRNISTPQRLLWLVAI